MSVLEEIDSELKSLIESPLPSRSYEEFVGNWRQLGRLSDQGRELVSERQRRVRKLSASLPPGSGKLHEYLYEELLVSHLAVTDSVRLS